MAYTKPQVIAQNASSGSFAAGCPANDRKHYLPGSTNPYCKQCELTM